MTQHNGLVTLSAAVGFTIIVALIEGGTWPMFALGASLALAVWLMLFFGALALPREQRFQPVVPAENFHLACAIALVIGGLLAWSLDNPVFWAVGAIAGGCYPSVRRAAQDAAA